MIWKFRTRKQCSGRGRERIGKKGAPRSDHGRRLMPSSGGRGGLYRVSRTRGWVYAMEWGGEVGFHSAVAGGPASIIPCGGTTNYNYLLHTRDGTTTTTTTILLYTIYYYYYTRARREYGNRRRTRKCSARGTELGGPVPLTGDVSRFHRRRRCSSGRRHWIGIPRHKRRTRCIYRITVVHV